MLNSSNFHNVSGKEGAIVYAYSNQKSNITITSIIVSMSESRFSSLMHFFVCSNVLITDSLFLSNMGILIRMQASYVELEKSNLAKLNCTEIYFEGCFSSLIEKSVLDIRGVRVEDVTHKLGGGISFSDDSKITLDNVNFESMRVKTRGACFHVSSSELEIKNSFLSDFKTGCVYSVKSKITLLNAHFSAKLLDGEPNTYGSTIYSSSSSLAVENCYFEGNLNGSFEGAVSYFLFLFLGIKFLE
jgi:hypothetical protein